MGGCVGPFSESVLLKPRPPWTSAAAPLAAPGAALLQTDFCEGAEGAELHSSPAERMPAFAKS